MKILHIISGLTKGGGERIAIELANSAVVDGNEVSMIIGWQEDPTLMQNSINKNVEQVIVSKTNKRAYLKIIPWIFKNKQWLKNFDVIHCHLSYGSVFGSLINIFIKRCSRKKNPFIIETYHAVGMPIPKLNQFIHATLMLQKDGVVFMAKDSYWDKFALKHPKLLTRVILNGVSYFETEKTEEAKKTFCLKYNIPTNCKYIIGTVGMLRPERKPTVYIPLFKKILNQLGEDTYFVIAGSGIEQNNIEKAIDEFDLSNNIRLLGTINSPAEVIKNMDMYVSVSVGETAGVSMIEAAMCKVPIVAIQLTKNYQSKPDDWIWSSTNLNEVANRIVYLLCNIDERNLLVRNQNSFVSKNLTSDAMYNKYKKIYVEFLQKNK